MKSDRNIKLGKKKNNSILSEDNYNNNTEQSTTLQYQYKTIENDSKNKNKINSNILGLSKKKKKKLTNKTKTTEQNEKKSPLKMKKEVIPNLFIKKIKNKIADFNKKETKRKRDKKNNNAIISIKNELPSILKNKNIKRKSIDIRMFEEEQGLESIIFDTINLSTSEDISFFQNNNKKNSTINSKTKQKNNNNGSKSINKINKKKNIKKKNNNNNQTLNNNQDRQDIRKSLYIKIGKTNTFHSKKKLNILHLSKRLDKKRKLSTANNEEEIKIIKNNTIDFDWNKKKENKKKITFKLSEDFSIKINDNYNNNEESDDFNLFDDYLYNKKIKSRKNTKKISHN